MKNKAINTFEYTGIVTLSQYIGTKKVKIAQLQNEGSYSLFNFFADCLLGDFDVAKINRPTKIMLLHKDSTTGEYQSMSGFIFQTSKPEKVFTTTTKITVRYSFIIPRELVNSISSKAISHIGLYANSAKNEEVNEFSAIVKFNQGDDTTSESSVIVVDWYLNISNKNKEVI